MLYVLWAKYQEDDKEEETEKQQDQREREVGVMGREKERESKRNPLNSFEILSKYIYLVSNMFPIPLVEDLLYWKI